MQMQAIMMAQKRFITKHFKIHTPMVCLPKADADAIANEFVTRLLMFLGCVPHSHRFQQFGLAAKLAKEVTIQTVCCCFDSLVTNLARLKGVRIAVHKKQKATGHTTIYPFGIQCQIHQLALTRKPLRGFVGFWSSIVRLAHLFEIHSFRAEFRSALLQIIAESFSFIPCAQVPSISHSAHKGGSTIWTCTR